MKKVKELKNLLWLVTLKSLRNLISFSLIFKYLWKSVNLKIYVHYYTKLQSGFFIALIEKKNWSDGTDFLKSFQRNI